jgi:hypothetical protein
MACRRHTIQWMCCAVLCCGAVWRPWGCVNEVGSRTCAVQWNQGKQYMAIWKLFGDCCDCLWATPKLVQATASSVICLGTPRCLCTPPPHVLDARKTVTLHDVSHHTHLDTTSLDVS